LFSMFVPKLVRDYLVAAIMIRFKRHNPKRQRNTRGKWNE
jgi:hypothetical protein